MAMLSSGILTANALERGSKEIFIQGSKGRLAATLVTPDLPEGKTCPMVIIMHGFMGNRNGLIERKLAEKLADSGAASIRFDFNGHGQSEGKFVEMTVPNEVEDALKVYEYAAGLDFVCHIAFEGHSQGGVVASMAAGKLGKKVAAVTLLAPAVVLRDDAVRGNTLGATYDPLTLTAPVKLFGDKELGVDYVKTAFDLPIYEEAAKYSGPACIIHGTGDRVVPFTYGRRYLHIWPTAEYHQIEGADHGFSKEMDDVVSMACDFMIKSFNYNHMTERVDFGAKTVITPLPVLLIGTYDADGTPDLMTAAWGGQCAANRIAINVSRHKTTDNILLKKCFTVSFADRAHVVEADYVGMVSGNNVPDKVAKAGLHPIKSSKIDAPLFDEFPLTIECRLVDFEDDGNGGRIVGEIVNLSVKPSILDENGQIDLSKFQPIMYDSAKQLYRVIGEPVGHAFSDGKKIEQ